MSSITNIVLQVETGEEKLVEQINELAREAGAGHFYKVPSELPGSIKSLEVDVYLMAIKSNPAVQASICECVREHQSGDPDYNETVLIITPDQQPSVVITPDD